MSTGRRTHYADAVRVKSLLRSLGADNAHGALKILPCRRMLGKSVQRTRSAVLHRDNRHALCIEIAADRRNLKSIWAVPLVASA